ADRAGDVVAAGRVRAPGADADTQPDLVTGGERSEHFPPDALRASATARLAGKVTAPGCNDDVTCASSISKPWIAVPLASAASAGLAVSRRANSDAAPPPLRSVATSPAILPHGCMAPKSPQPIASSRHSRRCVATSDGA